MANSIRSSAPRQDSHEENFFLALVRLASTWNAKLTISSHCFPSFFSMYRNLDTLRRIPILHVAEALGMPLVKVGGRNWAMKNSDRPREPTSLVLDTKTNRWRRWSGKTQGGVDHGSTLDLVTHVRECSFRQAVEFLTTRFL